MKVAVREAVEGVRHQADVAQPTGEVIDPMLGRELARGRRRQPQADAHRLVGTNLGLDGQGVASEIGTSRLQVGPGVDVGAITRLQGEGVHRRCPAEGKAAGAAPDGRSLYYYGL